MKVQVRARWGWWGPSRQAAWAQDRGTEWRERRRQENGQEKAATPAWGFEEVEMEYGVAAELEAKTKAQSRGPRWLRPTG